MSTYKLTYFALKGIAEPIRFLLSYGNIDFEDNRITFEEWPELKSSMPMGQMPILEVDGKTVHQSIAIARYLAKEVGLAGDDAWEDLEIDIAVDTFNDLRIKIGTAFYESDEEVKAKKFAVLESETIPFYLDKLEAIATENDGHLALGKLTWADFFVAGVIDCMNYYLKSNLFENSPNLQRIVDNVLAVDQVKEWIEKRPVTDF